MKKNDTKKVSKKKRNRMVTNGFCLAALLNNLKRLFLPWLIIALILASLIVGSNILFSNEVDSISATISFYYNGIEDGLDPNGCEFDKTTIKNDEVVGQALREMNISEDMLETVQNGILIDSIVSSSAINKISNYKSVYDSASDNWTESLKDSAYHPTAYRVSLNYNKISISGSEAADLLNLILEKYQTYFFETYGYNESVGNSVLSVDFESYDYLIALDMYNSKLTSLKSYIDTLSENDRSQFRSEQTGYSFSDLSDSVELIRSVDVDALTSYVLTNDVISDKQMIMSYYNFLLDNLNLQKKNATERLNSTINSIENYQKDSKIIYEGSADNATTVTETSDVYDTLIQNKIQLQNTISTYENRISDYTDRINSINKLNGSNSEAKKNYVESQLVALTKKTESLINDITVTANDYFETEKFLNAVNVTAPAAHSTMQYIKSAVSESIRMLIIVELAVMSIYLFASIAFCFKYRLRKLRNIIKVM